MINVATIQTVGDLRRALEPYDDSCEIVPPDENRFYQLLYDPPTLKMSARLILIDCNKENIKDY